ncbi:unnamed protein product [Ectocarpus sp. 12 AP-2014]
MGRWYSPTLELQLASLDILLRCVRHRLEPSMRRKNEVLVCANTLELQLVSLEICRACRSIAMLHVRVSDRTPRSVWSPHEVQTPPNTCGSNVRLSSRVPVMRARRLEWALPMKDLLRIAAIELWTSSEYLELLGPFRPASPRVSGLAPEADETDVVHRLVSQYTTSRGPCACNVWHLESSTSLLREWCGQRPC